MPNILSGFLGYVHVSCFTLLLTFPLISDLSLPALCFLPVLITCPILLVFTCVKLSISVLAHKLQSHCAFVICQFVLVPLCQAFQPYTLCVYFLVPELCLHYSASALWICLPYFTAYLCTESELWWAKTYSFQQQFCVSESCIWVLITVVSPVVTVAG